MMKMCQAKLKTSWFEEEIAFINKCIECGDDKSLMNHINWRTCFLWIKVHHGQGFFLILIIIIVDAQNRIFI